MSEPLFVRPGWAFTVSARVSRERHCYIRRLSNSFPASERLFLINPTMDGDSDSWHRPSWGVYLGWHSLVGDHAARLNQPNPLSYRDATKGQSPLLVVSILLHNLRLRDGVPVDY